MVRLLSTFGFFAGIGLLALAILNPPSLGPLEAREQIVADTGCRTVQVALDEGYGVTAMEPRQVCGR